MNPSESELDVEGRSANFTRPMADNRPTLSRGRPRAVTPELEREGWKLLLEQRLSVRAMCERLGVDQRSWYRAVSRSGEPRREQKRRDKRALSAASVEKLKKLRAEGLTLRVIAERMGLHINTVFKYVRGRSSDSSP